MSSILPRGSERLIPRPLLAYGSAALFSAIASAAVLAAGESLRPESVYLLYIAAVALTAFIGGVGPAMLAMTIGAVSAELFFIPPYLEFGGSTGGLLGLAAYLLAATLSIGMSGLLDRVRRQAVTGWIEARRQRGLLEAQSDQRSRAEAELRELDQELRENQAWLVLAQRIGRMGSWSRNATTGAQVWSDALIELFYGEPLSDRSLTDCMQLIHPDERELVEQRRQHALQTGAEYEVEFRIVQPSGQLRWMVERGRRWESPDGVGLTGITMDITDRKETEARARELRSMLMEYQAQETRRVELELERVRDQLVRQTRLAAIGQLSASIAHDLRNPLGVIRNAVYLQRRRLAKMDAKLDLLSMIDEEVTMADAIITNLMEMTRGRAPDCSHVDLGALFAEVSNRLESSGRIQWRFESSESPFLLWCDVAQFRQVLDNLCRNAVEAMKGRGELVVRGLREGEYDVIEFQDSGPGISSEVRERLFEPLVTSKRTGTGLGLMICRQIVERHHGRIDLDPSERGARFRIMLPRAPTNDTAADARTDAASSPATPAEKENVHA